MDREASAAPPARGAVREIAVTDAKGRLDDLLDAAERGEEVVITRDGLPSVRLMPIAIEAARGDADRAKARETIERFIREGTGARLDGLTIKELIAEGRR